MAPSDDQKEQRGSKQGKKRVTKVHRLDEPESHGGSHKQEDGELPTRDKRRKRARPQANATQQVSSGNQDMLEPPTAVVSTPLKPTAEAIAASAAAVKAAAVAEGELFWQESDNLDVVSAVEFEKETCSCEKDIESIKQILVECGGSCQLTKVEKTLKRKLAAEVLDAFIVDRGADRISLLASSACQLIEAPSFTRAAVEDSYWEIGWKMLSTGLDFTQEDAFRELFDELLAKREELRDHMVVNGISQKVKTEQAALAPMTTDEENLHKAVAAACMALQRTAEWVPLARILDEPSVNRQRFAVPGSLKFWEWLDQRFGADITMITDGKEMLVHFLGSKDIDAKASLDTTDTKGHERGAVVGEDGDWHADHRDKTATDTGLRHVPEHRGLASRGKGRGRGKDGGRGGDCHGSSTSWSAKRSGLVRIGEVKSSGRSSGNTAALPIGLSTAVASIASAPPTDSMADAAVCAPVPSAQGEEKSLGSACGTTAALPVQSSTVVAPIRAAPVADSTADAGVHKPTPLKRAPVSSAQGGMVANTTIGEIAAQQAKMFGGLPALPDGWIRNVSRTSGKLYFVNRVTGQTQYEMPTQPAVLHLQGQAPALPV